MKVIKLDTQGNQLVINDNQIVYFQSYNSIIARIIGNKITLDLKKWNYSVTTGKYRNMFLNETKKETMLKIKTGEYKLEDLNG